jgi:hypothetical protein
MIYLLVNVIPATQNRAAFDRSFLASLTTKDF